MEQGTKKMGGKQRSTFNVPCSIFKATAKNKLQPTNLLFVLCSVFLFSCENDENEVRALNDKRVMVEEALNVTSLLSQSGRMKAKLSAPLMLRYQTDSVYIEFPKTLHVDFFDSTGKKESQLDAHYAKYMETSSKVLLKDSVVVASVKGDTLRTSELWWDQNTHKFFTDKQVRLKTVDKTIYGGKGLEAEEDLSLWTIFETKGTVAMPEEMANSNPSSNINDSVQ